MTSFPLWAERLYNKPLAIERFKNEVLCEFAQARLTGTRSTRVDATTLEMAAPKALADDARYDAGDGRKEFRSKDSIAVIPVRGTLVHRGSWIDADSGLIGYNYIMRQARAAFRDPDIRGIFMPYESGGGECAGMFAAAEELASMAKAEGGKPIYAFLDERACSAAYVLASSADKVLGRREVLGASIAAIINVIDKSKAYEKAGLEPIVVRPDWADRKARGQDGEKIDADTIKMLGGLVDQASQQIVEFVSAMRGISEAKIKGLRGEVFNGDDLVSLGLMDQIASEQEAWDMLKAEFAA